MDVPIDFVNQGACEDIIRREAEREARIFDCTNAVIRKFEHRTDCKFCT